MVFAISSGEFVKIPVLPLITNSGIAVLFEVIGTNPLLIASHIETP